MWLEFPGRSTMSTLTGPRERQRPIPVQGKSRQCYRSNKHITALRGAQLMGSQWGNLASVGTYVEPRTFLPGWPGIFCPWNTRQPLSAMAWSSAGKTHADPHGRAGGWPWHSSKHPLAYWGLGHLDGLAHPGKFIQ